MKKKLCALALGFLGILTMNAQNLVKNGDFSDGTANWEVSGSNVELKFSGDRPYKGDALYLTGNVNKGDYVYQKIESIDGAEYKIGFAFKTYYDLFKVKLVWNTGEEEVFDSKSYHDANGGLNYVWHDVSDTGTIPVGATSVEIRFVDQGPAEAQYPGSSTDQDFYIDDVVFEVSGTAIPPEPLDAPQNVQASNVTKDGFTLSWDPVQDAQEYEITVNGQTVKLTETTYNVTSLDAGTKYSVSIKGISAATDNKVANIDIFTISNEKPNGDNVFFKGGNFRNGDTDLSKGWRSNSSVSISDDNVDGNNSTKMRVQNSSIATVARSNDFSVEAGAKYTISAYTHTPDKNSKLTLNIVWKKADGQRIETDKVASTKENYNNWESIVNEVTAPQDAVVAEIFFQLSGGQDANSIFYVDNIKVVKGVVAPYSFEVSEKHQRNATLSWEAVEGKAYKVVVNGGEPIEADKGMVRVNGLLPNTEYTAEVYATDDESKKSSVTFTTDNFEQAEGERIAYLSNIDENGVIPQEFFYNISELEGDAIKTVAFVYNELPVQESEPGKISLPATEGKKLVVTITQENGNQTVLTYYVVTFKK